LLLTWLTTKDGDADSSEAVDGYGWLYEYVVETFSQHGERKVADIFRHFRDVLEESNK